MTDPEPVSRDAYLAAALPLIPRLLQQMDRDPTSATYGCCDRQYWHYRALDFPCAMSQEFALPLAIVWAHPLRDNPWHRSERLRAWVEATLEFARRSAHRDGSGDDYHPFERALGAVVFSLHALAEAYRLCQLDRPDLLEFLVKRGRWAARTGESGVLTNHHAIAAAALDAVGRLAGAEDLLAAARRKAREVLAHQHAEGWYREYEGFDPGYQTVTVDFLARYWRASGDEEVLPSLERAVELLERVQHPDGTFGGEYGSRNTYHTQPHGFELLAGRIPAAARVADRHLGAVAAGRRAVNDDDRLVAHPIYPLLWAWIERGERPVTLPVPPPRERSVLTGCGLLIDRGPEHLLLAGLAKGGPFRLYGRRGLLANDSGVTLRTRAGEVFVPHRRHDAEVSDDGVIAVSRGTFSPSRRRLMTPVSNVVLRLFMLTVGRFARGLVRRILQRLLITGRGDSPLEYERTFRREGDEIVVADRISGRAGAPDIAEVWFGTGQTSIYIAASQPWEAGWLLPWVPWSEAPGQLAATGSARRERRYSLND